MKKGLRIGLWSAAIVTFLFMITLIVHIAVMVGNRPASSFYQLARVDFASEINDSEADQMKVSILDQDGAVSSFFNSKAKTLVYKFDTRYNNADAIYQKAILNRFPDSKRYVVTEDMAQKGCPVISDKSFYGRLTAMVSNVMY